MILRKLTRGLCALSLCGLFIACGGQTKQQQVERNDSINTEFKPGQTWLDTKGNPINAHGGGLLYHNGTYYWYGEYKVVKTYLPEWATWECYRTDVMVVSW